MYILSLTSSKPELVFHKKIEYYKSINNLLINKYIRLLKSTISIINETLLKNTNCNIQVNIVLEGNAHVVRDVTSFLRGLGIKNTLLITKSIYKRMSFKRVRKNKIVIWEVGGSLYIGYYKNGIRVVSELSSVFEKGVLNVKIVTSRLLSIGLPMSNEVDSVGIYLNSMRLNNILIESLINVGYTSLVLYS